LTQPPGNPILKNPFWRFSLDRYARDGVAAKCLFLQSEFGCDVNLLLFGFWLGTMGRQLRDRAGADNIIALTADWRRDVVLPLRSVRVALRDWPTPDDTARSRLRDAIKRSELDAEQVQQAILYDFAQTAAFAALVRENADRIPAMVSNAARLAVPDDGARPLLETLALICAKT